MTRRTIAIIAVVLLVALGVDLVVMHNKKTPATSSNNSHSSSSQTTTPANVLTVNIKDFVFTPNAITVRRGSTVTWINNDSVSHTVIGDSSSGPQSGTLAPGDKYLFRFDTAGTFKYHCGIHADMTGTVIVTAS